MYKVRPKHRFRKVEGEEVYYRFYGNGQGIKLAFSDHAAMVQHVAFSEDIIDKTVKMNAIEWVFLRMKLLTIIGPRPDVKSIRNYSMEMIQRLRNKHG